MAFLENINSPSDLKKLNIEQTASLAAEIRREIIDTVSANGGHLASNLGIVELTLALHRVFDLPNDSIVFDVGHQCYVREMDFQVLQTDLKASTTHSVQVTAVLLFQRLWGSQVRTS